jgi:uncharacterized UBP type Zn finger protein
MSLKIEENLVEPNESYLKSLIEMGFNEEESKEALIYTNNKGVNDAMDYIHLKKENYKTYEKKEEVIEKKETKEEKVEKFVSPLSIKLKGDVKINLN